MKQLFKEPNKIACKYVLCIPVTARLWYLLMSSLLNKIPSCPSTNVLEELTWGSQLTA